MTHSIPSSIHDLSASTVALHDYGWIALNILMSDITTLYLGLNILSISGEQLN